MIKKLVAFGCSWTYGDELVDPDLKLSDNIVGEKRDQLESEYRLQNCFSGLLAKHYNLEYENFGFPGASEESIRYALNWFIENHDVANTCILVAHTDPSRKSWFNSQQTDPPWNRFVHSPWLKTPNPQIDALWYQMQKMWLGLSYHRDWVNNNFIETVQLFDWVSYNYKIPVIQVKALQNHVTPPCKRFVNAETSLQEILFKQQHKFMPGGHPTDSGHKILSKHLIDYIDSAKIL